MIVAMPIRPPARRMAAAAMALFCLLAASCSSSGGGSAGGSSGDSGSTPARTTAVPAVAAKPSPGCATAGAQPAVLQDQRTVDVDGTPRQYLLTLPPSGDKPRPLVLDFHGLAEGMQVHAEESQFGPLAQKDGFVVVQPNGTGSPLMWDTSTDLATNKDLKFITTLLHTLASEHCIDETRIYSTGLSMGAFMTSTLTCAMSDRMAGAAPVAGVQMADRCEQSRPVPILAFHGTQDPILFFNGGIGLDRLKGVLPGAGGDQGTTTSTTTTAPPDVNGAGYPETVRKWAKRYDCGVNPTDTKPSQHVTVRSYRCPAGVAVDFAIVDGGGHSWPGSQFDKQIASIVGPTNYEVNASELIWKFFRRFQVKNPPPL